MMLSRTMDPEQLHALVQREVRKEASDDERQWLQDNPDVWYEGLVAFKDDLDGQLAGRAGDMAEREQECFRQGAAGKEQWFREKAEYERWRGKVIYLKSIIERQAGYAKRLKNEGRRESDQRLAARLKEVEERLDILEEHIG